jgi:predicted permease
MMRTVFAVQDVRLGIRTDRLLTLRVPLPMQRYPDAGRRNAFFRELLARVSALPGVAAAGLNTGIHPLGNWNVPVEVVGNAAPDGRPVVLHQVSVDYVKALGIPLLAGRSFDAAEVERGQRLAVVNQAFVRRYAAGRDVVGRVVRVARLQSEPFKVTDPSFEVVGVVQDTLNRNLTDEVHPELYVPSTITGLAERLAILTEIDPAALAPAVRAQVHALDPEQPVTDVRTMQDMLESFVYSGPRFTLALFAVFAALGLCLAVVGVYGVVSHAVSRRTAEIGVRLALGASARQIAGMVVGSGLRLVGLGVLLGLLGSAAAGRVLRQLVWSVSPFDPLSFAAVAVVLVLVGVQACLRPALRAARVDPVTALRYE